MYTTKDNKVYKGSYNKVSTIVPFQRKTLLIWFSIEKAPSLAYLTELTHLGRGISSQPHTLTHCKALVERLPDGERSWSIYLSSMPQPLWQLALEIPPDVLSQLHCSLLEEQTCRSWGLVVLPGSIGMQSVTYFDPSDPQIAANAGTALGVWFVPLPDSMIWVSLSQNFFPDDEGARAWDLDWSITR